MKVPLDDAMDIDDVTPIEVRDSSGPSERSNDHVTETVHVQGPPTQGTVTIDEESDDDNVPFAPTRRRSRQVQDYNDIEEEMIQAAIEALKVEVEVKLSPKRIMASIFCFVFLFILWLTKKKFI